MTVSAPVMRNRRPKIAGRVTCVAVQIRMLPDQAKPGAIMIETLPRKVVFPSRGGVALFAPVFGLQFAECTAMRIGVTAYTATKGYTLE